MSAAGPYKVLEGAEKIRQNPGMYIGDNSNPTHLVIEVLDNMLDELANKHGTIGAIKLQDEACYISDNGSGIKVYPMTHYGVTQDSVYWLCTEIHSGGKFEGSKEYANAHIGMHGVGLVAVNALSDWLLIKTRDRDDRRKVYQFNFLDFKLHSKEIIYEDDDGSWSTIVGFKPSSKYFDSLEYDIKEIVSKLILCQAKYPHASFYLNETVLPKKSFDELVRQYLQIDNNTPLFRLEGSGLSKDKQQTDMSVFVTYTSDQETITLGDVNLRICDGTYLTQFQNLLKDNILQKINKKFNNIPSNLLNLGLKLYISLSVPRAKFDSQTKTRMKLDVSNVVNSMDEQVKWFLSQDGIISTIETNLELKLKRNLVKLSGNIRKTISAANKLKDCSKIPGDVLYILEGDSALGTLKQVRNVDTEAIFPLRGKVLNVESSSFDKIENNKEIKQLLEALGPRSNRRYRSVKILADADPDGYHIAVLVLILLYKFADDYIKEGKLSIVLPPLYGAEKGTSYIPVYDHQTAEQYRNKGFTIYRFKGLGEMNPEKLDVSLRSGIEYVVTWPETENKLDAILKIITDTNVKRLLLNDDRCVFETVLNKVISKNPN